MLLNLPELKINNEIFDRISSVKFLEVMLDEKMSWRIHMRTISNKISKTIGLLYREKQLSDQISPSQIFTLTLITLTLYGEAPI